MPNLTPYFYETTKVEKTKQYIETGAYMGEGIQTVLHNYERIHSIELTQQWYDYNVEKFRHHDNVVLHHGDSKKILPVLLESIHEPITIYLDAHYAGGTTGMGEEETPLLFELEILKKRPYDDIIIIDDSRLFGKKGTCGNIGDPIYPTMEYDWTDITEDKIRNLLKENYVLLPNEQRKYTDGCEDQLICVKPGM